MPKAFQSQVIAYLKASKLKTGLLVNFGNHNCIIRRLVNNDYGDYKDSGDGIRNTTICNDGPDDKKGYRS